MANCSSTLTIAFSLALSLFGALASPQIPTQGPPSIEVLKFSWSKERLNWERDPFAGPVENFDEMRARTRNEKRLDDAKRGGGGSGADRVRREAKADEANLARKREGEKGPPRYAFIYKARIKNNGPTAITLIDWDYVFNDAATGEELARHQFTSEETLGPGKTKEFTFTVSAPPTQRISVYSLEKNERQGSVDRVVVVRVKYADGTEWTVP